MGIELSDNTRKLKSVENSLEQCMVVKNKNLILTNFFWTWTSQSILHINLSNVKHVFLRLRWREACHKVVL